MGVDGLCLLRESRSCNPQPGNSRLRRARRETALLLCSGGANERRAAIRLGKAAGQTQNRPARQPEQDLGRIHRGHPFRHTVGHWPLVGDALLSLAGVRNVTGHYTDGFRSRLIADMTNPPPKPISVMASDIPDACQGEKGVAHQRPVPNSVAERMPPMNPSQVLFGLTCGAILCLPSSFPQTYCSTSLICTTRTK